MNPNKTFWEKGDFTQIAALMRQSGEAIVRSLGITPPFRALDLGCGDGTTAIPLARQGGDVVDDECSLQGGDDDSFDLTLSVFGAMFAPKSFDVAREMVRVTKPGGPLRVTVSL